MNLEKRSAQKNYEPFWFMFLAGTYALMTFAFFLNLQIVTINTNYFYFYILGWAFFLPLGFLFSSAVEKLKSKLFNHFSQVGFIFAFLNFIFLLYWLSRPNGEAVSIEIELGGFLLLQCVAGLSAKIFLATGQKLSCFLENALMGLMCLVFVVWVLDLTPNTFLFLKLASFTNLLVGFLFILIFKEALKQRDQKNSLIDSLLGSHFRAELVFYIFAFLIVVILVVDPAFRIERYHDSFYLGPLADFCNGKAFLANINAQYGLFVFYFLSLFFKILPLGFKSFSLILTLLFVAQYFCFYFIVRQLFSSRLFSLMCLMVLLLINYFATMGHIIETPSVGPIRFGFVYLLLALMISRNQRPELKNYFYAAESAVAACAFFWSFEVCVYTLPAYLGFLFYESIEDLGSLRVRWEQLIKRLLVLFGFCLLLLVFIYGDTYRRAHEWPSWDRYFNYIFLYQNGFGRMLVPALGAWWIIVGILFISMCVVVGSLTKWKAFSRPAHFNAMVFLTFYGIFQFFYFLGRAHPNNLFHISMPSVLLGAYWIYWLGTHQDTSLIPELFKKSILVMSVIGLSFYLQFLVPDMVFKLSQSFAEFSSLPQKTSAAARNLPLEEEEFVKTADALMNKYSGSKKEVVYFFGNKGLDVSMYTGRVKAYPYNDIGQLCICGPAVARVMSYQPAISTGDYFYLSKDIETSYYDLIDGRYSAAVLEKTLLYKINKKFNLKFIENQKGISVMQIVSEKNKSSQVQNAF